MARRYEIDDAQWKQIRPFLGNTPKKTGRSQADNRKLLNGVLWIMHTGAPWRDLPEYYGNQPRGKINQNPRGSGWTRLSFGAETHRRTGT